MEKLIPLSQIALAATETLRNAMHFCLPGSVVAFYPNDTPTPTADVQPMLTDPRLDLDTGEIVFEPWSVVQRVPVAYLRGGKFLCAFPLLAGDPVVLQAFDLDPTQWRANGRGTKPLNPADCRRHGGGYWRCVPTDLAGPIASASAIADGGVVGIDGDQAQVQFAAGSIQLGATGGDAIALASKVLNELNAIKTTLGSLTGASFGTPYTGPGTIASSLVKAQ